MARTLKILVQTTTPRQADNWSIESLTLMRRELASIDEAGLRFDVVARDRAADAKGGELGRSAALVRLRDYTGARGETLVAAQAIGRAILNRAGVESYRGTARSRASGVSWAASPPLTQARSFLRCWVHASARRSGHRATSWASRGSYRLSMPTAGVPLQTSGFVVGRRSTRQASITRTIPRA
jgi:hypothetical protein